MKSLIFQTPQGKSFGASKRDTRQNLFCKIKGTGGGRGWGRKLYNNELITFPIGHVEGPLPGND